MHWFIKLILYVDNVDNYVDMLIKQNCVFVCSWFFDLSKTMLIRSALYCG